MQCSYTHARVSRAQLASLSLDLVGLVSTYVF